MKLPTSNVVARLTSTKLLTTFYILLTTFLLSSFLFANPAYAAISTGDLQDFQETIESPEYNKESFDAQSMTGLFNSISTGILGCITQACLNKQTTGQGGALTALAGGMDWMYINQPASGVAYFADLGKRLNIVQPVYAQETGFQALSPLLAGWRATRNMSYVFFVIVFVLLGLGIMLRTRINPQTVITIQSALPRIIISLILITFSYAIAGLMIDLMRVSIGLSNAFLSAIPNDGIGGFLALVPRILTGVVALPLIAVVIGLLGGPALPGAAAVAIVGAIGTALIMTLLGILLLFALFRVFFIQLTAFIGIALRTVFAPIILLFHTLPNGELPMGWIRPLVADISVFVVVPIILSLATYMMQVVDMMKAFNFPVGPIFSGLFLDDFLKFFLVIATLMMIPNIVNMVKERINQSLRFEGPGGLGVVRGGLGVTYQGLQYAPRIEKIIGKPGTATTPPSARRAAIDALVRILSTGRL